MNFKKWRNIFLIGVAVVCAAQTVAWGASSLSFGSLAGPNGAALTAAQILAKDLLEGYWSDVSGADPRDKSLSLMIASSVATFNIRPASLLSDVPPSNKYFAYKNIPPGYYFWRYFDDAAPGVSPPGGTIYVRIWSDESKTYYTYDSFANGTKDDLPHMTNISAGSWYKAAKPDMPLITQFEEVATTVVATGAKSGSLRVISSAPAVTDGLRQINSYAWQMGTDPASLTTVSGNSPTLTLDQATLTVGTPYYFRVIYTNWFGSTSSAVQQYTVAGGTGNGPPSQFVTYLLTPNGLGLNVVSIDFDTTKGPIYSSDGITIVVNQNSDLTVQKLINEINKQAGATIVKSIGYYDNAAKKQVGLSSVAATLTNSTAVGDTTANILAHQIKEPLQISVSSGKAIVLNGTK
jgi:hypothetical protein